MEENNEPIQTQQAVQQWEYISGSMSDDRKNKLGEEGWEAVGYDNGITLFKRPKPKKTTHKQSNDYGYSR